MSNYQIGPGAHVDYTIDWGPGWLGRAAIVASRWSVDGDGGLVADARPAGERRTGASFSGGLPGERYTVSGHVLLSDGRRATRSLTLEIGDGR